MTKAKSPTKTTSFPMGTTKFKDEDAANAHIEAAVKAGASVRIKHSLAEPGDSICGLLVGNGDPADFEQPDGEVRTVQTWDFDVSDDQKGGRILNITSSAQLDSRLPAMVGCVVQIIRAGQVKSRKGNQVTTYHVINHTGDQASDTE